MDHFWTRAVVQKLLSNQPLELQTTAGSWTFTTRATYHLPLSIKHIELSIQLGVSDYGVYPKSWLFEWSHCLKNSKFRTRKGPLPESPDKKRRSTGWILSPPKKREKSRYFLLFGKMKYSNHSSVFVGELCQNTSTSHWWIHNWLQQ